MSKRILAPLFSLLCVLIAATLFFKQDAIYDMWRLYGYQAPAEIAALADATTMKNDARRLFYVYRPQLEDRSSFNQYCVNAEQTIVLGCYIEYKGIYLYRVTDERLKGVIEVTAAHEMLHAAYDRLSSKERARIDALTAEAEQALSDNRVKENIDSYRKKDSSVVPNELHSILATEVSDLPTELEDYYGRYFTNRKAIVALADSYKQAFREREDRVTAIDAQLSELRVSIDANNNEINRQQSELEQRYTAMQQSRRSNDTDAYNAAVPIYNQLVNQYNALINRQRQIVAQYNELVEERNELATEENELIEAIDSRTIKAEQ